MSNFGRGTGIRVERSFPGAPAGCIVTSFNQFVFVETCGHTDQSNCGTLQCASCAVRAEKCSISLEDLISKTVLDEPALTGKTPEGHAIAAVKVSALGGTVLGLDAPGGGLAQVSFPESLKGFAVVTMTVFASSPHAEPKLLPWREGGGIVSGVVDVSVDSTLEALTDPIIIQLPRSEGAEICKWFDISTGDWSADGCELRADGSCACAHLTTFAACHLIYECSTLRRVSQFPA